MNFILGNQSRMNLTQVHPDLVRVVEDTIKISPIDFRVQEGVRTASRQKHLYDIGASTTLESMHLIQADGFGHAVDLVPWVDFDHDGDSELRWDWPLGYKIAEAVQRTAILLAVGIRWGGCWDKLLNNIGDPEHASMDYILRRRAESRRAFVDAPHFELYHRRKK